MDPVLDVTNVARTTREITPPAGMSLTLCRMK